VAAYITQQQLSDAWGADVMLLLFDDGNTGNLYVPAINLVITRASARVTAWMPDTYDGTLPFSGTIPEMIMECAFEYARYFAYPRNPDYMRALGLTEPGLLKSAEALGQKVQEAVLRLYDAPAPTPDNVGGDVDGNDPNKNFAPPRLAFVRSMGDF
jgi:hypothetical protein